MNLYAIGVVADSHIPDRRRKLHVALLPKLREADVQQILHVGDISLPRVLHELEEVAPVVAVRGNRDWLGFKDLPLTRVLDIQGKRIGLTHGHGGLILYLQDKARFMLRGPQAFGFFMERAVSLLPADVDAHRGPGGLRDGQLPADLDGHSPGSGGGAERSVSMDRGQDG